MLFLTALAIALLIAFLLDKPLKKCPAAFYITAAVLTVAAVAVTQSDITISSRFVRDYVLAIFSRGALGAAFWAVVMWAGALPNGSAPIKKLMPIRGELSITAAILTLSHVITYGVQYISNLVKGRTGSDFVITSVVSLAMVAIMLPLTVMSFKTVRRKMNAKTWKRIQRAAYVFYGLIFAHVMVLYIPRARSGRDGCFLSVIVYSAVFLGYAAMRIRKAYIAKKKPTGKAAPNVVCACGMIVPLCVIGLLSLNTSKKDASEPIKENAATFTFEAPTSTTSASTAVSGTAPTTAATAVSTSVTAATESTSSGSEEATYRYKNGTFDGSAEGYAGKVTVSITIENGCITSFSASAADDDPEYFGDAMQHVIPQIQQSMSADVDACSGATYSSKGIMEAAGKALEKAMK
ncbi:MAG: FMN-binding protein [Ruminococcus sp.]|nr:FMN-binding protein [Ruminococcus sp.]